MTTLLTLVILAVLWAAVLLPGYLRNRTTRHSDSVVSFRRLVTTLERTGPDGACAGGAASRPGSVASARSRCSAPPRRR